ncbi:MAG: TlpA disulfide reductase family protein [Pseudomonadota bacterium]
MLSKSRRLHGRGLAALLYGAVAALAIGQAGWVARAADTTLSAAEHAAFKAAAAEALPKMVVHAEVKPPLEAAFRDGEGAEMTLADFEGDVVVLNVWATWCPPCRKEMPSIDRLAKAVADDGVSVVALSTDRGGADPVRRFFDEIGVEKLGIYVDKRNKLPREAAVIGLPATLILNREGEEIARLTGDAEWDTPEVIALIRSLAEATDPTSEHSAADPAGPDADAEALADRS